MTFDALLSELSLRKEIADAVRSKISKDEKLVRQIALTAYQAEAFDFPLCRRMPLTRLAAVTVLLLSKYGEYKSLGTPDGIIWDTFRDVTLRAELYFQRTGKPGLSKEDVIWFRHIMNRAMFKIGPLQYQPFEMLYLDEETIGEPYMTFPATWKQAMPNGTPVINCHIQRGADLRDGAVDASLAEAKDFFARCFPDTHFRAFLCYSWLLYPPMTEHLDTTSSIRRFADRFTIIGSCADDEQARENLFDATNRRPPAAQTSLQKMALEHRERFGFACGIIPIE